MTKQKTAITRTIPVTLGGRAFALKQRTVAGARQWRAALTGPLTDLITALRNADKVEVKDWQSVAGLLQQALTTVAGAPDSLIEALFAYDPALAAERAWIEENCYDDELLAALLEVLKAAYPFGSLLALVSSGTGSTSIKRPT